MSAAATDASGAARCVINPTQPAGAAQVTATYPGTSQEAPATATRSIAVLDPTVLSVTTTGSRAHADTLQLSAHLAGAVDGTPAAGQPITLTAGSAGCTATTDQAGDVACQQPVNDPVGAAAATASYGGDTVRTSQGAPWSGNP